MKMVEGKAVVAALLLLAVLVVVPPVVAQTSFTVIPGNPLRIHVGADTSFQVFNADVPGSGQIYPSACQRVADMGVFAAVEGTLFAPDFRSHGCSTATGGLGTYTPWTQVSLSRITGLGSRRNPYIVRVTVAAGNSGVRMVMTVRYVNGDNFFRVNKSIISDGTRPVRIFEGADIFLASSDRGVFYVDPTFNAPGGQDCATPPTYTILLIPLTPANAVTASGYSHVWSQIGARSLDNDTTATGCVDNGAAIQWDREMQAGQAVAIDSAVSFGEIPDPSAFQGFSMLMTPPVHEMEIGETATFIVETRVNEDFEADINLGTANLPPGMTATLSPTMIPSPGNGSATLTVTALGEAIPGLNFVQVLGSGGGETHGASAQIDLFCNPPFILGMPSDQPLSQTVKAGDRVVLKVNVSGGSSPFRFEWFQGPRGSVFFPVGGADGPEMTTPPITIPTDFWVRVSNACGSIDSWAATIMPTGGDGKGSPLPRRTRPTAGP